MVVKQFIPPADPTGGTQVGNSYLSAWANCPRDWYNRFLRPTHDQAGALLGTGLRSERTGTPLLVGRVFHEGLAAWYESGVRDGADTGERSIDKAIATSEADYSVCKSQFESPEVAADCWLQIESMLRAYHDRYGPDSVDPEWPTIEVLCDAEGEPLVEREWKVQLAEGYVYTCRTDLICLHRSLLKTMEHKTTSVYGVKARCKEMDMDTQFTGEYWILHKCFPDETLAGVMVNMIIKNRSPNSKYDVAHRETTTRHAGQLARWETTAVRLLQQIDEAVGLYHRLADEGLPEHHAADVAFPDLGTRTKQCYAYGGTCEYLPLCQMAGMESKVLPQYDVKFNLEEPTLVQQPPTPTAESPPNPGGADF